MPTLSSRSSAWRATSGGELSEEIAAADAAFVPMSATTAAETAGGAAAEVTEEKRAMPSVVLSQRGEARLWCRRI